LTEAVAELARRVEAIEARIRAPKPLAPELPVTPQVNISAAVGDGGQLPVGQTVRWLTPVGRSFMVLGGAFLLRALTDSGQLPTAGGVWLGLGYALIWLVLADRGAGLSGLFHGLTALVIGLPLIVEAAVKFKIFSADASAAVLGGLAIVTLAVSWRRGSRTLAAVTALGTLGASLVLAVSLGTYMPFTLLLLGVGVASLWIAYARDWPWLPWLTAGAADLAILAVAVRASITPPREDPVAAQILHAGLIAAYLGSFVVRVLVHEREVRSFEIAQTAIALVLGLTGAVRISHAQGFPVVSIALACLIAGSALYVQTFFRVAARRGLGSEFYYFGMTALALTLTGASLAVAYPARPVVLGLGALAICLVGWRMGHPMLVLQGSIAMVVASGQSGLLAFAGRAWLTRAPAWPADMMPIAAVLLAAAAAVLTPRAIRDGDSAIPSAFARTALSLALVMGLASVLVATVVPIIAGTPADPGVLATTRTIVLALTAAALATVGRSARFVEMKWLAYAALAAGAVKILAEDLPSSRPATLFIALAAYGAALIAVPKISKQA
jgi:hypothetical protein